MKSKFTTSLLFLILFLGVKAQNVPNGSFETWTSPLNPDGWCTLESIFDQVAPGLITGLSVKDMNDPYAGTSSIKIKTDSIQAGANKLLQNGIVSLGTGVYTGSNVRFNGIAFPFRPDTLYFAYKYQVLGPDTAYVNLLFKKTDNTPLLGGAVPLDDTTSSWSLLYVPLTSIYANSSTPDSLLIQLGSSIGKGAKKGSTFNVDGVRFAYVNMPTLVEEINSSISTIAFPNPATTSVRLSVSEMHDYSMVMVYDITGRVMTHEFLEGNNHDINVSNWPAGMYNYAIIDNGKVTSKGRFTVAK